jgi:hypothetical protein
VSVDIHVMESWKMQCGDPPHYLHPCIYFMLSFDADMGTNTHIPPSSLPLLFPPLL